MEYMEIMFVLGWYFYPLFSKLSVISCLLMLKKQTPYLPSVCLTTI